MKSVLSKMALMTLMVLTIASCGNKDADGNDVVAGYYVSNGYCYGNNNVQVDNNNCSGMYDYYSYSNNCYTPYGVRVDGINCQNNNRFLIPQPRECGAGSFYSPSQRRSMPGQNRGPGNNPRHDGPPSRGHGVSNGMSCGGGACQGRVMYSPQGQLVRCR